MNMPPKERMLTVGQLIEQRYRIRSVLGEGARGRVFLADDTALQTQVAIKVGKGDAGQRLLRLEQEARLALSITHPNVCQVLGFGRLPDGRPYLVMEALLRGRTLSRLLRRVRVLDETLALRIAAQLLSGLDAAHRLGIIHRDVKPSNVFLVKRAGAYPLVKLLDFGIAKPPPEQALVTTRPGFTIGTPGYAAPEVLSGHPPDARSDIWAVGVLLFEMLAGIRPFRDASEGGSLFSVVSDPPRSLAACAPYLADWLVAIVETALRKHPDGRFQSALAFLTEIESALASQDQPSSVASIPEDTETSLPEGFSGESSLPLLNGTPSVTSAQMLVDSLPRTLTERLSERTTPPKGRRPR